MAQSASGIAFRGYDPGDEGPVLELLGKSLGESPTLQRTPDLWQWKHRSSPFGPSYIRVSLDEDGFLVGMRAFMRWEFKAGERLMKAVRAVDTATHPNYRRMGIFSTLTSQVVAEVERDGVDLIFNTPNKYSLPGYLKLGWGRVATVHPLVKVLDYPRFGLGMARRPLGISSSRRHLYPEFFRGEPTPVSSLLNRRSDVEKLLEKDEVLWQRRRGIRTRRSWRYLRWRYGEHPTIPYWAVFLEHDGDLVGWAIFRTNSRFGLKEVVLCELFLAESMEDLGHNLLSQLRSSLRADYLITYFPRGSFHRRMLERWGFRVAPGPGIDFTVRPLVQDLPQDPLGFDGWALTMGDLELL